MMNTYKIYVDCVICGKEFEVEVEKNTNKILTDCYHSKLDLNWFDGWTYSYNDIFNENGLIVNYKNLWYKIIGYTKIQRKIVYFLYELFHRKNKMDYWECPECAKC